MPKAISALVMITMLSLSLVGCGPGSGSTVIDAPEGTAIPTEDQLKTENEQRTLEMSGGAAEMAAPQGN